jgi:hypothetical protein
VADPFTGEVKTRLHVPYPNNSAALTTVGGLLITAFTYGTVAAYDDTPSISYGISMSAAASTRLQ